MTAPSPAPRREPNPGLEGLRGIACLLVACSHVFYLNNLDRSLVLPEWLRTLEAGHTGVLVFFLLSGYVIGWTNPRDYNPSARRSYILRRLVRLAPIYYVALALSLAVNWLQGYHGQVRTYAGAALGLQNFNDYFGLVVSVPMTNGPLWSLNYELLYYAAFILVWRWRPALGWIFLPALALGLGTWFAPQWIPLFLGSYACGWLFWAAGWWLSRQPELTADPRRPVLTWLLLVFASHQLVGMMRLMNFLGWHNPDAGMITLGQLGALPAILLLLAAVTRRALPGEKFIMLLAWLFTLAPLAVMLAKGSLWTNPSWLAGGIAVGLAVLALPLRRLDWLKAFAWLGGISYAFYVVHFPLLFVVERLPLPRTTLLAYSGRIAVWAVLALTVAWVLERRFQPWIKTLLPQAKGT